MKSLDEAKMELGVKSAVGEGSSSESLPDIHDLFSHYNSIYFDDALGACIVYWSDSRTDRVAGMCYFVERGMCEIRLSEPLLKFRSSSDMKNTLLHEMIHAFLYVTSNMKDHSYHGPSFSAMMNTINSSSKADPQRPSGGYNITFSHYSKTVNSYGLGQWICTSCGDIIKGPVIRKPSANDCIKNMADDNPCDNLSCHWHRHKILCAGRYTQSTVNGGCKYKMSVPKDAPETLGDKSKVPSYITRQTKKISQDVDDSSASSGIKAFYCNYPERNTSKKQLKPTPSKVGGDTSASKIPKRPRTARFDECHTLATQGEGNHPKCEKENTSAGQWFAFYGDEESDEDIKPLVNKRTKRREMEKLAKLKAKRDAMADGVARSLHYGDTGEAGHGVSVARLYT